MEVLLYLGMNEYLLTLSTFIVRCSWNFM